MQTDGVGVGDGRWGRGDGDRWSTSGRTVWTVYLRQLPLPLPSLPDASSV